MSWKKLLSVLYAFTVTAKSLIDDGEVLEVKTHLCVKQVDFKSQLIPIQCYETLSHSINYDENSYFESLLFTFLVLQLVGLTWVSNTLELSVSRGLFFLVPL